MSIRCAQITRLQTQCKMWTQYGGKCHLHARPCECVICLTDNARYRLRCGHQFHNTCISRWQESGHNTCPTCRELIDPNFIPEPVEPDSPDSDESTDLEAILDDSIREMIIYFLLGE